MIKVTAEPWRRLVRAKMSGLLTVEEVLGFTRELRELVCEMKLGPEQFSLLVETQANVVQQQAVMALFQELITRPKTRAKRIAIVRPGVLGRMQARRLAAHRAEVQVFDNMMDADVWLRTD